MKVLLIEDSETCAECLLGIYNKRWFCLATNKDIDLLKSRYEKPSWCPLRPLPQFKEEAVPYQVNEEEIDAYQDPYATGFNDAIRLITGEADESQRNR